MKYLKLVAILAVLLIVALPTTAFASEPPIYNTYEQYGPRAKNFLMAFHANAQSEFDDLAAGGIDIVDWPLTKPYYDLFTTGLDPHGNPYSDSIAVVGAGPEYGMYIMDINNNYSLPDGTHNPGNDSSFRHAIWHLIDRNYIATVLFEGFASALWSPVAAAAPAFWNNPACVNAHPYDLTEARRLLDEDGYTLLPGHDWRTDPVTGVDLVPIKVYARSDHSYRKLTGEWFAAQLNAVNIPTQLIEEGSAACYADVMVAKNFFSYTGGWSLGVDVPDVLYGLFHSSMYWTGPSGPPNYGHYNDALSDYWLEQGEYAPSAAAAIAPVQQWQLRYINPAWVPAPTLCSNIIFMAHRKYYGNWGGEEAQYAGLQWSDILNIPGRGIGPYNNFWTFMNMQPEYYAGLPSPTGYDHDLPGGWTIRWGWKVAGWSLMNPVYGSWVWDWAVMNYIYDTWLGGNPMVPAEDKPWMAYQYDYGLWHPTPTTSASYVTLKIRDDVYWSDGEKMTMEDFRWMIGREPGDLIPLIELHGLDYPFWYSSVQMIDHADILDSQTIKIYYSVQSYLALHWIGGLPLIPKHIWEPIFRLDWTNAENDYADHPEIMIGNGPYKLVHAEWGTGAGMTRNDQYYALNPVDVRFTAWNFTKGADKYTAMTVTPINYLYDDAVFNMTITNVNTAEEYYSGQFKIKAALTGGQYGATNYTIIIGSGIKPPLPNCTWIRFDYWYWTSEYSEEMSHSSWCLLHVIIKIHLWDFQRVVELAQAYDWTGAPWPWPIVPRFFCANTVREDINCDGYVNIKDAVALGVSFGSAPTDLNWDSRCDMYSDGHINIKDAVKLGRLFSWPNMCPV